MNFDLNEEEIMIQRSVKEFSNTIIEPIADKIDNENKIPDDLIEKISHMGLFGMTVPKKYGGSDVGELCCIMACEQMAYSGTGVWWLVAFNNSIPETLYNFGSDYIRNKYLRPLCEGRCYASIQFTEAETGSDPKLLTTKASFVKGTYIITGSKRFSTFGARDGCAMLFTKDDEDQCTAFVIDKNTNGYSVSKKWDLMGGGGIEAVDVYFDNMRVPEQNILGVKGKGFDILLFWIAIEKIQQCAACVGIAQAALDEAIKFSKTRMSKGKPISNMQGIRWMLAEMHAKIQAARWLTYKTAYAKDKGEKDWMIQAATAKLFVVPNMIEVVDISRRIHGAYGYTKEFKVERLYRAIAGASAIAVGLEINKSIVGSSLLM